MDPLNALCLAVLVFLSLPLPLFASAALGACPAARGAVVPWAWGNSVVLCAAGLLVVAAPVSPWLAVAVGGTSFVICGAQMFRRLARVAGVRTEGV